MTKAEITEQTQSRLVTVEVLAPESDTRALNAQTHGMTSEQVPPSERGAYLQHVQAVRESSGARGYLQERLADRAALALWRLERVARFEAAQVSVNRREALQKVQTGEAHGLAGSVTRAYGALADLTYEDESAHRADPGLAEERAREYDAHALMLTAWADGGSAEGLNVGAAEYLGDVLGQSLKTGGIEARELVKAMMGRPPKRGEVSSVECDNWIYEPGELPGLLSLARTRWGELAPVVLRGLAERERLKGEAIRQAQREAVAVLGDVLAAAELPRADVLEKVTRYEAHLERVLYRALHDLEALRREADGQPTPGPLRGVLDTQREP